MATMSGLTPEQDALLLQYLKANFSPQLGGQIPQSGTLTPEQQRIQQAFTAFRNSPDFSLMSNGGTTTGGQQSPYGTYGQWIGPDGPVSEERTMYPTLNGQSIFQVGDPSQMSEEASKIYGDTLQYDPTYGWYVPEGKAVEVGDATSQTFGESMAWGWGPFLATMGVGAGLGALGAAGIGGAGAAGAGGLTAAEAGFGGLAGEAAGGIGAIDAMTAAEIEAMFGGGEFTGGLPEGWSPEIVNDLPTLVSDAEAGAGAASGSGDSTGGFAGAFDMGGLGGGVEGAGGATGFTTGTGGSFNFTGFPAAAGNTASSVLEWMRQNPGLVNIGGNLASGVLGAVGANRAAGIQADASNAANQTLWNMYQQNRADLEPWRTAGVGALGNLTNLTTPGKQVDAMMLDPGYQFRLGEGQKALETQLRAGGKFYSGDALKAGTQYNQNFATGEFGNVFNRNATLAGLGQTATNTGVASGQNTANNVANNLTGAGNARASGYVGAFNSLGGALGNATNYFTQQSLLDQLLRRA